MTIPRRGGKTDDHHVRGLAEPVEVYEVTGAVRTRLQASAARGLTRFVGRAVEVDQLPRALDRAGQGHRQLVAVVGEAGVGKSRLWLPQAETEMAALR